MTNKNVKIGFASRLDQMIGLISPERAFRRKQFRFAYDALDRGRTRKKRLSVGGSGDRQLGEMQLAGLRDICREMGRNNPLVKGLLRTERDGLVGSGVKIKARTSEENLNDDIESLWKEDMIDRSCDVTGRFNFNQYLRMAYLTYRRDGDMGTILLDNGEIQPIEGEQIGTPWGQSEAKHFVVSNGIAYSKSNGKVIGYYVGKPNKWGFIGQTEYHKYKAENFYHMFNPERFSNSRGEPALTSSINWIDQLCDYMEAELVAAKVNACFSMFVSRKDEFDDNLPLSTGGVESDGTDEEGNRLEKIEPGRIMYGEPGEDAKGIGQVRPGAVFDPFVLRMLTMIGRPLNMPLMLITLDFSGATFMNARIAYQKVQESWTAEQDNIIKPFVAAVYRRWIQTKITVGKFKERDDIYRHDVLCKRWPYVDPLKEAKADEQEIINRTNSRTRISARKGDEQSDIDAELSTEKARGQELGLEEKTRTSGKEMENIARGVRSGVPIAVAEARARIGLPPEPPKGELLRFNDQDVLQYHVEGGILTINEIRKVLGLKKVKWGNVPVRKTTVSPVSDAAGEKEKEKEKESETNE